MATIGYARVSIGNQHLDMQLDALRASGCTRIHTDTASGALSARPGLDQALAELDEGDTLVVWRLDRLGHSLPHHTAPQRSLRRLQWVDDYTRGPQDTPLTTRTHVWAWRHQ